MIRGEPEGGGSYKIVGFSWYGISISGPRQISGGDIATWLDSSPTGSTITLEYRHHEGVVMLLPVNVVSKEYVYDTC